MEDFNAPIQTVVLEDTVNQKAVLSLAKHDIILNALNVSFTPDFLTQLTALMSALGSRTHSRVLVALQAQYIDLPEDWIVVPTEGEAEDVIQMERIERDLGI